MTPAAWTILILAAICAALALALYLALRSRSAALASAATWQAEATRQADLLRSEGTAHRVDAAALRRCLVGLDNLTAHAAEQAAADADRARVEALDDAALIVEANRPLRLPGAVLALLLCLIPARALAADPGVDPAPGAAVAAAVAEAPAWAPVEVFPDVKTTCAVEGRPLIGFLLSRERYAEMIGWRNMAERIGAALLEERARRAEEAGRVEPAPVAGPVGAPGAVAVTQAGDWWHVPLAVVVGVALGGGAVWVGVR